MECQKCDKGQIPNEQYPRDQLGPGKYEMEDLFSVSHEVFHYFSEKQETDEDGREQ